MDVSGLLSILSGLLQDGTIPTHIVFLGSTLWIIRQQVIGVKAEVVKAIQELKENKEATDEDLEEIRREMNAYLMQHRNDIEARVQELRQEMRAGIQERKEVESRLNSVLADISNKYAVLVERTDWMRDFYKKK